MIIITIITTKFQYLNTLTKKKKKQQINIKNE